MNNSLFMTWRDSGAGWNVNEPVIPTWIKFLMTIGIAILIAGLFYYYFVVPLGQINQVIPIK